jgi:putative ABC transport system ATP-binding protein
LLRFEEVRKDYNHRGKVVRVLDRVTLEIGKGDYVSVVGPSGSGKSTLLLMLGGMLSPSDGRVLVDGESLYELAADERAARRRKKIGFVFQMFNLIPYLTALENVQVPLLLAGVGESRQRETAAELLGRVGLGDRLDHKPSELSIGQQQRVALARMLANEPAVVLADEPTGNLDPETGRHVLEVLGELHRQGRTVVMVTHDPNAAGQATRSLRLHEGAVIPA